MEARVTDDERARFRRQVESLQALETDDPGSRTQRHRMLVLINRLRRGRGLAPYADPEEQPPELEFFRKAEACGMVAARRWGP